MLTSEILMTMIAGATDFTNYIIHVYIYTMFHSLSITSTFLLDTVHYPSRTLERIISNSERNEKSVISAPDIIMTTKTQPSL